MSDIYTVICEWDIGQEGQFFSTTSNALEFVESAWNDLDMEEEVGYSIDQAMENGLLLITDVELN